ncbi:hypothetical protein GFS03_06015 [Sulfolobus sp. E5-1-F]|uniref:hypothetical protein n=1 Tax=Saccharolobus sp. E5-1-F TaxID=2663019 RepID=UPI0012972013|nr:hypothetical protein [Sulfolobus sp. E5-1-F]QGA54156.1 hypothetical protein GFS03_06015 [Sulfolobus sp. E5-1-F]
MYFHGSPKKTLDVLIAVMIGFLGLVPAVIGGLVFLLSAFSNDSSDMQIGKSFIGAYIILC